MEPYCGTTLKAWRNENRYVISNANKVIAIGEVLNGKYPNFHHQIKAVLQDNFKYVLIFVYSLSYENIQVRLENLSFIQMCSLAFLRKTPTIVAK